MEWTEVESGVTGIALFQMLVPDHTGAQLFQGRSRCLLIFTKQQAVPTCPQRLSETAQWSPPLSEHIQVRFVPIVVSMIDEDLGILSKSALFRIGNMRLQICKTERRMFNCSRH